MNTAAERLVIVGGGLAGVRTAQEVRDTGFTGEITMVSEEARAPYDRPPLSKEVLLGTVPPHALDLFADSTGESLGVLLLLDHKAVRVELAQRVVHLHGAQESVAYDQLVVATGCQPRRLPVLEGLPGVHYLRTADQAQELAAAISGGGDVIVVGAGFIGLEVASVARQRGCTVTIVEVAEQPLVGPLGVDLASWLRGWHEDRGTRFHCGVGVASATHSAAGVELTLEDGSRISAPTVVVGIGITRDLEWLAGSGLETHQGLVCDEDGRTSDPAVFAVGDIGCRHTGDMCRPVQHWTAAGESAHRVARALVGAPPAPIADEDFFWSNQGDLRLQSVGAPTSGARLQVISGSLAEGKFVAQWLDSESITGVVGCNHPREFLRSRMRVQDEVRAGASASAM